MIEYSVVVPAYNAAKTLPQCLSALQRQSIESSRYEIIVVDDGSIDQTAAVAGQILAALPHGQIIRATHGGPAAARNIGIQAAQGSVILFTDSDCEPEADWIEQMTRPFGDPQIAGVMGAYRTRQRELSARFAQIEFEHRYALMSRQPTIDLIATYSAAYRHQVLTDTHGFDSRYIHNEDVELAYRIATTGHRLAFNPQACVFHSHPPTFQRYLVTKFKRGYWRMLVYHHHPGKALQDSYTPQSLKLQVGLAGLMVLFVAGAIFWPGLWPLFIAAVMLFIASTFTFVRFTWARDQAVGLIAIPILLARSIVFGCGVVAGILPRW